jgi:hypothetical protein
MILPEFEFTPKPPVQLMHTYKGKELGATILPTGRVRVGKHEFDSSSTAAVFAIKQATGQERSINGWDFWQVPITDGKRVALATIGEGGGGAGYWLVAGLPVLTDAGARLPCRSDQ